MERGRKLDVLYEIKIDTEVVINITMRRKDECNEPEKRCRVKETKWKWHRRRRG